MAKTTDIQGAISHLEALIKELTDICSQQQTIMIALAHALREECPDTAARFALSLEKVSETSGNKLAGHILSSVLRKDAQQNEPSAPSLRVVRDDDE